MSRFLPNAIRDVLRRMHLSLELLVGRRLALFAIADGVLLLIALLGYLLAGSPVSTLYIQLVLLPSLLLGVPALSRMVALERVAGSLDLALSVPRVEAYFLRRAGTICLLMLLQAWIILLLAWLFGGTRFPLIAVLTQSAAVCLLLGALALFWSVRLKTSGAVLVATLASVLLLGRWFFSNPIPENRLHAVTGWWLPSAEGLVEWLYSTAVLGFAIVLAFFYARRRLRRPQTLLS